MKELFGESKYFKHNKITHIPTFYLTKDLVDLEVEKNDKETLNIDFCYLGRIADDKGVDVIIEAVNILKNKDTISKNINCR